MPRSTWSTALSADMNVTPMLDVLLVLLVIFMAAIQERHSIDVQLPVPCEESCQGNGMPIVLEVLHGQAFLLNGTPVAATELNQQLRTVYAGRPDKVLQVAGHRDARYQDVISAMDVARSAGVRVIGIPPSGSYTRR